METLQKQVRRAHRRLLLEQLLGIAIWSLFGCLAVAALAIAARKIWVFGPDPAVWTWSWIGGSVGLALLVSLVWTWLTRRGVLDAAIEIDRRYALKERVSSALALKEDQLDTQIGRALLSDAVRRVERVDVAERFRITANRRALLPLVPALAVFLLTMFVSDAKIDPRNQAAATPVPIKKQIKKSTSDLKKKFAARRKEAEEKNLKDAADLFKKLEDSTDKLASKEDVNRRKARIKLNDLAKELKKRRQSLGDSDTIKRQLNKLKNMKQGPADNLAKAIKDGQFKKALDELKNLKDKLKEGKLTEEEKKQLAEQLAQMENKLREMADAHQQAKQELKEKIEQAEKAGDKARAGQLQQQLDRLEQQNEQMDRLNQMAQKLGQCKKCLGEGNLKDAAAQLDALAGNLEQMQQEVDELEMLDDALDQIALAKDAMNCKQCMGAGCAQCQGGAGNKDGPPGRGLGEGQGKGDRPEEETDTKFYKTRVKGRIGPGKAVITGEVTGPNIAGQAREEIKNTITAARRSPAQPLTSKRLPRSQRQHVKQYLESLRTGK